MELDQVLLHDAAHLARRNDWSNLAQQVVVALFRFNPAVLWISRQLSLEREIACDDRVTLATGTTKRYALCLTKLAELARFGTQSGAGIGSVDVKNSTKQEDQYATG